jgi:hypothetical protein
MKTIEQINNELQSLLQEKRQVEDATLSQTIYDMFAVMTKEEVLAKIGEMMQQSQILKNEVKKLLIDTQKVV